MVKAFPPIKREMLKRGGEDRNPAVQLFGRRFFGDQTVQELLVELLLVVASAKKIGESHFSHRKAFPEIELLRRWPDEKHLEYAPKSRLNLKLFAFLGASKLETRHESHRDHYRKLLSLLKSTKNLEVSGSIERTDVLRTLENLFLGFQGVGSNRTWCANSFFPVVRGLIAGESIWMETRAKASDVKNWDDALGHFSHSQAVFLARGGELLYLQLCNAMGQNTDSIKNWFTEAGISTSERESISEQLYSALEESINSIIDACPETINKLASFIDTEVDSETAEKTDQKRDATPRYTSCGWCPQESWREGLLFAVELIRICDAVIDPVHRLELLEIACAVQVLRSLCAQSARYVSWAEDRRKNASPLGYVWAISDPEGRQTTIKQISRRCVNANQRLIFEAIRNPDIIEVVEKQRQRDKAEGKASWKNPMAPYLGANGADSRYGHKLFLTLSKRIGFVVPKRGAGARFVLNERLLRFIVMSVIRPGDRITYETFKKLVFAHYGLAFDDEMLGQACVWSGTGRLTTIGGNSDTWLIKMLDEAGVLIRLSDSCSMVVNPFNGGKH